MLSMGSLIESHSHRKKISELEDKSVEITQIKRQRVKEKKLRIFLYYGKQHTQIQKYFSNKRLHT